VRNSSKLVKTPGIALVALSCAALSCGSAQQALASSCKIDSVGWAIRTKEGDAIINGFRVEPGTVVSAGDLKIRVICYASESQCVPTPGLSNGWMLEIKAPDGLHKTVSLGRNEPLSIRACGADVTISAKEVAPFGRYFSVDVF
jgi:hypothetical protein